MTFSPREREVLEIVERCSAIGFHVLAQHLEARMPADELETVVDQLRDRGAVAVMPAKRSHTISITSRGRLAIEEAQRG